jgi:hypothetical protein
VTLLDHLLADMDENLDVEGDVPLMDLARFLRGQGLTDAAEIEHLCAEAYREFISRHDVRLVWLTWPSFELADREASAPYFGEPVDAERMFLALIPDAQRPAP